MREQKQRDKEEEKRRQESAELKYEHSKFCLIKIIVQTILETIHHL